MKTLRDICLKTISSCPASCKPLKDCSRFKTEQQFVDDLVADIGIDNITPLIKDRIAQVGLIIEE